MNFSTWSFTITRGNQNIVFAFLTQTKFTHSCALWEFSLLHFIGFLFLMFAFFQIFSIVKALNDVFDSTHLDYVSDIDAFGKCIRNSFVVLYLGTCHIICYLISHFYSATEDVCVVDSRPNDIAPLEAIIRWFIGHIDITASFIDLVIPDFHIFFGLIVEHVLSGVGLPGWDGEVGVAFFVWLLGSAKDRWWDTFVSWGSCRERKAIFFVQVDAVWGLFAGY